MDSTSGAALIPKGRENASGSLEILMTFQLGSVWYALNALQVQEVILVPELTPVPGAKPHILGIMNLRGRILPVFDLGLRLGLPAVKTATANRVMVVPSGEEMVGLLVDSLADVAYPETQVLQPLPSNVAARQARYFTGTLRIEQRLLTVLNLAAVVDLQGDAS
jgi:purine-binding chemotaxis protein CheW